MSCNNAKIIMKIQTQIIQMFTRFLNSFWYYFNQTQSLSLLFIVVVLAFELRLRWRVVVMTYFPSIYVDVGHDVCLLFFNYYYVSVNFKKYEQLLCQFAAGSRLRRLDAGCAGLRPVGPVAPVYLSVMSIYVVTTDVRTLYMTSIISLAFDGQMSLVGMHMIVKMMLLSWAVTELAICK